MSVDPQSEQLRVAVELGADLAGFVDSDSADGIACRDALLQHLRDLVLDLGIPADPVLSVEPLPAESNDLEPYRVWVGDTMCAPELPHEVRSELTPESVADEVALVVTRNREFCVTSAIAKRLLHEWEVSGSAARGLSLGPEDLQGLLRGLLRRCAGVAPPAAEQFAPDLDTSEGPEVPSVDQICEAVLAARGDVSLRVFVGSDLAESVGPEARSSERPYSSDVELSVASVMLTELFFEELGVLLPDVVFDLDPALGDGRFRIQVNDLRFPPLTGLLSHEVMVNAELESLNGDGITGGRGIHPTHGGATSVIEVDDRRLSELNAKGHATWGPQGYIAFSLAREIRRYAGAFLMPDVLTFHLNRLREDYSALVDLSLARFDQYRMMGVLRRLLDDQISIRDLAGILDGLLAVDGGVTVDESLYRVVTPNAASLWSIPQGVEQSRPRINQYADCVRRRLRGQVTSSYAGAGRLTALVVDDRLEARVRESAVRPFDNDERERIRQSVCTAYEPFAGSGVRPVVLTNSEVRRSLRRVLENDFPYLPVLSRQELAPGTEVYSAARIVWA